MTAFPKEVVFYQGQDCKRQLKEANEVFHLDKDDIYQKEGVEVEGQVIDIP